MSSGKRVAIVSKLYCTAGETVVVVRRRPHVVNGGGFVVMDCEQNVVFRVDGCGVLGTKGELLLRDANGRHLLLIQKKGGMVQALSIHSKWRGYTFDFLGNHKPIFTLKDPKQHHNSSSSCFPTLLTTMASSSSIRIFLEPPGGFFEIKGYFPDRVCSIVDSSGNPIAQIGEGETTKGNRDVYKVAMRGGVDQAFVFGVIAILDYIYGESTCCT